MAKNESVTGLNIINDENYFCKGCVLGKMARNLLSLVKEDFVKRESSFIQICMALCRLNP